MSRQLLDLVTFVVEDDVLLDAHGKTQETNYTQHVVVVVEETGHMRPTHGGDVLVVDATQRVRAKELCLLDVRTVHLVQLPAVSVCVDTTNVLDCRVYVAHVFQAPDTRADHL